MLYFKALFDGLDAMPAADAGGARRARRARPRATAGRRCTPSWRASIRSPRRASRRTTAQRIQRALEVHRVSGRPLSAWHTAPRAAPRTPPLIALEPRDRAWLHARIDAALRRDARRRLRRRGAAPARARRPASPTCRRCAASATGRPGTRSTRGDLDARCRERGIAATRQLAKRQLTWLRSMPQRHVIACDDADAIEQVVRARARRGSIEDVRASAEPALLEVARAGQALRRRPRLRATSTSASPPASSSRSSANRASASRRC